jgi:hypothetical protein
MINSITPPTIPIPFRTVSDVAPHHQPPRTPSPQTRTTQADPSPRVAVLNTGSVTGVNHDASSRRARHPESVRLVRTRHRTAAHRATAAVLQPVTPATRLRDPRRATPSRQPRACRTGATGSWKTLRPATMDALEFAPRMAVLRPPAALAALPLKIEQRGESRKDRLPGGNRPRRPLIRPRQRPTPDLRRQLRRHLAHSEPVAMFLTVTRSPNDRTHGD